MLKSVLEAAVEGASVLSLCEMGDRLILEETGKVYKKEKEMKKGTIPVDYNHVGTKIMCFLKHLYFPNFIHYIKRWTCQIKDTLQGPKHSHSYCTSTF